MSTDKEKTACSLEAREAQDGRRQEASMGSVLKTILPAAGGSFIEWYDFAIYSYVASYITDNFFANGHGGSIGTWASFASTFAFRPLGGAAFGYLADCVGRKPAMQLTILIMLIATFGQGCLPTFYSSGEGWGWFGMVMLIVCRALQGLSAGGELSTAAVYISEVSPPGRLGFYLSWISVTGAFGAWTVAAFVVWVVEASLSKESMQLWGWRLPYLFSAVPGVLLIIFRRYLKETEEFEHAMKASTTDAEKGHNASDHVSNHAAKEEPLRVLAAEYKSALIVGSLGTAGIGALWFVPPLYGTSFIKRYHHLPAADVTLSEIVVYIIPTLLSIPYGIFCVDRFGAGKCMLAALFLGGVVAPIPLFYWWTHVPESQALIAVYLGQVINGIIQTLTTAVYLWVIELFPVRVRATGTSVAYNLGVGIFGGLGPLLSDAGNEVLSPKGLISAPALFTFICCLVSFGVVLASRVLADRGSFQATHIRNVPY